ncbi:uncharacterized protein K02A2.6-like [Anopheles moucheti]|uniref:uncharacterized protein K02A2.6-like n=1 Tax=Anopheles moucheti TaxID=186751 RepID=UPI0022F0101B|nr:uncharacterized protein K02A2.6-like [Anopheles moucheti]
MENGEPSRGGHSEQQQNGVPNAESNWIQEIFRQQQISLHQQQEAFLHQQEQLVTKVLATMNVRQQSGSEQIIDALANHVKEFRYNPDDRVLFAGWFTRYGSLFEEDAKQLDEAARVRLLLRKLGIVEHERYVSHILPSKPNDFDFAATVDKLKKLFGSPSSEMERRYKCLNLVKTKLEDFVAYSCRVNKAVVESELGGLSEEELKCLLFVCGLKEECYADVRTRLLSRLEDKRVTNLSQMTDECKRLVQLQLKDEAIPVFRPKRPVAYAMLQAVNEELQRLEERGIIARVEHSEWAAPIVVVRKANGSIRIYGDYSTGLNNALMAHQYPLPLPEDIFTSLSNCTVFSQLDLSDAFLQVEVDEKCRELLTVNTHRGLFKYNRLPPGVKAAPGAFQQLMDTMVAGLVGVAVYLDDIVIGGKDMADHDKNLHAVLQKIQEYGFTLRAEKCSFRKSQIKYLGHLLDAKGLRPDPEKISAIIKLQPPTDVSGVR